MGKFTEINVGVTRIINSMISLGLKKSDMIEKMKVEYLNSHDNLSGFLYSKNPYLRSTKSIDVMRQAQKIFVEWARKNSIFKLERVTRDDLCRYLLDRSEQTSSAWSLSRDLHFVNKIFKQDITKRELALPSRLQKNITRGRNGQPKNRPNLLERNKNQICMVRATGMRRSSVTKIRYSDFNFHDGRPISVKLIEKGGKVRNAYILPDYQERVMEILEKSKNHGHIFRSYAKDINSHFYRHEYAENLLKQLLQEHRQNKEYFQGEFKCEFRLTTKEKNMEYWRDIPVNICGLVSSCLGHNRVCILSSYIWD